MSNGNDLWDENRRRVLKAMAAAAAATTLPRTAWADTCTPLPYNVLWLMADEHNPFVTHYAGDPVVQTPKLDELAARSTIFRNAYTTNPICVPARQAIQTGRMSSNLNWNSLMSGGKPNFEGMGPYFQRMGYKTAWYGKQHWDHTEEGQESVLPPEPPLHKHVLYQEMKSFQGLAKKAFEDKFGVGTYPTDDLTRKIDDADVAQNIQSGWTEDLNEDSLCTDAAIKYLEDNRHERFFMGVSWVKPHFPFVIQRKYFDMYDGLTLPEPPVTPFADLSTAVKRDWEKYKMYELRPEEYVYARKLYYGMVSYIDKQVGAVLKKLDNLGLRDNTIVIYCADHGELLGQHHMWYKNAFFEASARIPMLISMPGVTTSRTVTAPVSLLDLYPTLCDLLCLPRPLTRAGEGVEYLEGRSLVPLINGDPGNDRIVFAENNRFNIPARMVRTNQWKYCFYDYYADRDDGYTCTDTNGVRTEYPALPEQLYDMQGDDRNREAVNLVNTPPDPDPRATLRALGEAGWKPWNLNPGDEEEA